MKPKWLPLCFRQELSNALDGDVPNSAPSALWPTRDTVANQFVVYSVVEVFVLRLPSVPTCPAKVPLTEKSIVSATRSNVRLIVSSILDALLPATRSVPSTILPCGTLPLSCLLYSLHTRPSLPQITRFEKATRSTTFAPSLCAIAPGFQPEILCPSSEQARSGQRTPGQGSGLGRAISHHCKSAETHS